MVYFSDFRTDHGGVVGDDLDSPRRGAAVCLGPPTAGPDFSLRGQDSRAPALPGAAHGRPKSLSHSGSAQAVVDQIAQAQAAQRDPSERVRRREAARVEELKVEEVRRRGVAAAARERYDVAKRAHEAERRAHHEPRYWSKAQASAHTEVMASRAGRFCDEQKLRALGGPRV